MSDHYHKQREQELDLNKAEVILERFKIVEDLPGVLDVQFDGKTISIASLVKLTNQLASALNDRGCRFEVVKNEPSKF